MIERRVSEEKEAYETLIQDGGQPSHPIELKLSSVEKLGKYKDIISYWKVFHDCEDAPFFTQLDDWKSFRKWQDTIRAHHESQNSFADYPREVNEVRRRHNLEGNADIRLDYDQQSGLDNWMEYQHFHLDHCENLEEPLNKAKGELDAAKKEVYEAGDSKFGDGLREKIRSGSEDSDYAEDSRYSVTHEPDHWTGLDYKLRRARMVAKYKEQAVGLLKHQSNVAESGRSKEISERDQNEAASAMKQMEDAKKKVNKLKLRVNLVEAARDLASIKKELKFHKIMVDWIEQQRPLIAAR